MHQAEQTYTRWHRRHRQLLVDLSTPTAKNNQMQIQYYQLVKRVIFSSSITAILADLAINSINHYLLRIRWFKHNVTTTVVENSAKVRLLGTNAYSTM
jgi:hypothetical protein